MGQTETSSFLWASEGDSLRKPGTVGKPVFHAEVRIFDKEGRDAQPGEVGEIVVRGPIVMTNYWQDPVKTKEAIKNGWLHTGDLARMDDEGYFYPIDRLKDMYISGGENVYTAEVEQVLREHPAIEDVAVVGISDDTWGETGLAFIIPKSGAELSAEAIFSFCEGKLAHFKLPKKINFCQDFPRTSLGKVQKSKLIRSLDKRMNSTTNPKIQ
jgi:fatty-acyl-CoA synthase